MHDDEATPALDYDGTIGGLYRIFLINLLLTVVTLGIWRFWGITRIRRYLWSHTSHYGHHLEYDGTGGQLLVGFLLALGSLLLAGLVAGIATYLLAPMGRVAAAVPFVIFELMVIVLTFGAVFSAQRYRLNHTLWCGIRGGMTGSMLAYGLRSILYYLVAGLTLGQLMPWATLRLTERRLNASFIGNMPFVSRGRAGHLYVRYLALLVGDIVVAAAIGAVAILLEGAELTALARATQPGMAPSFSSHILLVSGACGAGLLFGLGLFGALYRAVFIRHLAGHTRLGGLRFSSNVSGIRLFWLLLSNFAIVLFTLGLGTPIVIHRNTSFLARHLLASGVLGTSQLRQGPQAPSRFGEGMFQVLDAGVGI